jgi:hypothetical protein
MAKPYEEMTKAELEGAIRFLKLDDEVAKVAKYPAKVTNAEYIQVLNAFKAKQNEVHGVSDEDESESSSGSNEVSTAKKEVKIESTIPKSELKKFDSELMVPVIVTDYDNTQFLEEEMENRTIQVRWGNVLTENPIASIALHGRTQYIPKGCIAALRDITFPSNYKNSAGIEISESKRKRFHVAEVEGWTPEELEAHKREQLLKRTQQGM